MELFEVLTAPGKSRYEKTLQYLYCLLIEVENLDKSHLKAFHVQFQEHVPEDGKLLIAEFIWQFYFRMSINNDNGSPESTTVTDTINYLRAKAQQPIQAPERVSKAQLTKLRNEKRRQRQHLGFYETLKGTASLLPETLLNLHMAMAERLRQVMHDNPTFISTAQINNIDAHSYVIYNTEKFDNISKLKVGNTPLLKVAKKIVLFDCESSIKRFGELNFIRLADLNKNHRTNFEQLLVFSWSPTPKSFYRSKSRRDLINERYKIPANSSYVITAMESLLDQSGCNQISVHFTGIENSHFWDAFVTETTIRELYELRSIKLLNIYSLCYNEDIKNYLISDLFGHDDSKFISNSTKEAISELDIDTLARIRNLLDNVFDLIIQSEHNLEIAKFVSNDSIIVVSDLVVASQELTLKISDALGLGGANKIASWAAVENLIDSNILLLCYQDQGRFPNHILPNIFESALATCNMIIAVYVSFLFRLRYQWSLYAFNRDRIHFLSHDIRRKHFAWGELQQKLNYSIPKKKMNLDWSQENQYSSSKIGETYRIRYKAGKARTYTSSDLFIFNNFNNGVYRVDRMANIFENFHEGDDSLVIQNLDDIQEDINIYDKIVDTTVQEQELRVIRKQFQLEIDTAGSLWKVLLKEQASKHGEVSAYENLRDYLRTRRLNIVSFQHYKNTWINPGSDSTSPLSRNVFLSLCEYLNLPRTYFVIVQRLKNSAKQSSRHSTRQMNLLLKDLFNDGCFDVGVDPQAVLVDRLTFYKKNHPLDELGIDENHLLGNLVTLVELIIPELRLFEIVTLEKIYNE
ncbi:hypothetical protein LZD49_32950 [Dyadobacter sp. CY261]|uniref:hypothetical protein n=1 Tax=Dyadobacter sp. CY261 TaxID=2907203 RepID=UPI001F1B3A6F|nr:hypothetical protein [Dyadobacter sp. CY261]MCF0075333.1 hypothetical protein [Dyadobacter sp. CY261]